MKTEVMYSIKFYVDNTHMEHALDGFIFETLSAAIEAIRKDSRDSAKISRTNEGYLSFKAENTEWLVITHFVYTNDMVEVL